MRNIIYIAGPITRGIVEDNVRAACYAGDRLIHKGYSVIIPQLSAYLQSSKAEAGAGHNHQTWMEVDLPLVAISKAVLRIPGYSRGGDDEVTFARGRGIPVFFSEEELVAAIPPFTPDE